MAKTAAATAALDPLADAAPPASPLEDAVRELILMLDYEIGRRWCSFPLRLKLEEIEIMLGDRGTWGG